MIYTFLNCPNELPYNNPHLVHKGFTQHESQLTAEEIAEIRRIGDGLITVPLGLTRSYDEEDVRAKAAHLPVADMLWFYDKMFTITTRINDANYQFDLTGFAEEFYYIRYDAPLDHFNWHFDLGHLTLAPRKLSLVLQLSDPSEYEGGDLQFQIAPGDQLTTDKGLGIVTAFPSWEPHKVTPITSGVRFALAAFAVGPSFR
jgi:PKHD-type hydroxylase